MRRWWVLAATALCGACSTPMLVSVDLTREPVDSALITYGVGVTEIEVKALPFRGVDALPEPCKAALDTYDVQRADHQRKRAVFDRLNERAVSIRRGLLTRGADVSWDGYSDAGQVGTDQWRSLSDIEKSSLVAELVTYEAAIEALRSVEVEADLAEQTVREKCPDEARRLEFTRHVEPSPDLVFAAVLRGGVMSDDTLNITSGADGLPTAITATANDGTTTAVENAGKLIGRLSAPAPWNVGLLDANLLPSPPPPPPPPNVPPRGEDSPALSERCGFGFGLLSAKRRLEGLQKKPDCVDAPVIYALINELWFNPARYQDLRPSPPQPPRRFSLDDLRNGSSYGAARLEVSCAQIAESDLDFSSVREGLVVATPLPCRLVASIDYREVGRINFIGLSADSLSVVPIERAALVNNTTTLTLVDGTLRTVNVSRPSVGAAVVALPGKLIGGIVTGIGEALRDSASIETARLGQINAETNRINAEAGQIQASWTASDTSYIAAMGLVGNAEAAHVLALQGTDSAAILSAEIALRNAQAAANAAAATARRPLPFPGLL